MMKQLRGAKMSDKNTSSGVGFGGLLTILFIGLKLGGIINWSWWWVLSPIWLPIAVLLFIAALLFLVKVLLELWEK